MLNLESHRRKASVIILLSIVMIASLLLSYQIGRASVPASGPYYLNVPFGTASWYIDQFDNATYYAVRVTDWKCGYYDTNQTAVIEYTTNNLSSTGGVVFLRDQQLPDNYNVPDNILIIESYEGFIRYFDSASQWTHRRHIVKYIENYTWTDLDAEQGVATDGTYIYISGTNLKLQKWTKTGTKLYEVDATGGNNSFDHVGDICYYNGYVYAPLSDWVGGAPVRSFGSILRFHASNMSFDAQYDISTSDIPNDSDLSGIAYDSVNTEDFWILAGDNRSIYRYNEAFAYQSDRIQMPYLVRGYYDGVSFSPLDGRCMVC